MWTPAHQRTLDAYAAFAGLPHGDADARQWTRALAEQFAFRFPSEGWGTKQADPGRPPSTDVICTRVPFVGYDVLIGQGTASQAVATQPAPINLAGQLFIAVEPFDHIGRPTTEPEHVCPTLVYPSYPPNEADLDEAGIALFADFAKAGQPPNPQMFRFAFRVAFKWLTKEQPTLDASVSHTRAQWRKLLGLPPLS